MYEIISVPKFGLKYLRALQYCNCIPSRQFLYGSVSSRVPSSTIQIRSNIPYKLSRVYLKHRIVQIIIYFRIIYFLTINIYLNIFKSISLLFLLFFFFSFFFPPFFPFLFFSSAPFSFAPTRLPQSLYSSIAAYPLSTVYLYSRLAVAICTCTPSMVLYAGTHPTVQVL